MDATCSTATVLIWKDAMKGGVGKWVGVFLLMNLRSTDMTELNASNKHRKNCESALYAKSAFFKVSFI